jgi:predicted acyl esterase
MALSYVTEPLAADTAVVGGGALEAWIRSTSRDVDLQATVSEVRPDGLETFVQSGWLRASARKLDTRRSTLLEPVLSLRRKDSALLPKGHNQWVKATVPLYYQGHLYRAGSRLRVTLAPPRGDQPVWRFGELRPRRGGAVVYVSRSPSRPSRLILPVVAGIDAPTAMPPCPGLRGEPCRGYQALANGGS